MLFSVILPISILGETVVRAPLTGTRNSMPRALSRSSVCVLLLFVAALAAFGQPGPPRTKPFAVGETLVYEAKASKIISGIAVADLKFSLSKDPDSNNYLVKTEAVSKGTLLRWFRFSFLQQYESIIDAATFGVIKTTKHDVQKERVRNSVADFDYDNKRVTFVENDPKEPNRPPRRIASDLPGTMNDIVSAVYALRMRALAVGQSFEIPVSDSGLNYNIPVRVAARERIKTEIGRLWCFRLEPVVFGRDRLVDQKGKFVMWLTDDERHLPVRGRIETEAFRVEVRIRSVSGTSPES